MAFSPVMAKVITGLCALRHYSRDKERNMQLGKFDSDRDSVLHFLCSRDWANESTGDISTMGKFVWRISNSAQDVALENTEFESVLEEWLEYEVVADMQGLLSSLVGHFLVQEFDNGRVLVLEYGNEASVINAFNLFKNEYESVWLGDDSEESVHFRRNGETGHQW